jgi:lipoate-protein ligase A
VANDFKLVGSAQRRRAGAILQHGSILLRQSDRTPELRGVCDLADVPDDPCFWAGTIEQGIMRTIGLTPRPLDQDSHAELRCHALELERTVYVDHAWTARR